MSQPQIDPQQMDPREILEQLQAPTIQNHIRIPGIHLTHRRVMTVLRTAVGLLVFRDEILEPVLAAAHIDKKRGPKPKLNYRDQLYRNIQINLEALCVHIFHLSNRPLDKVLPFKTVAVDEIFEQTYLPYFSLQPICISLQPVLSSERNSSTSQTLTVHALYQFHPHHHHRPRDGQCHALAIV